ncbi:hypothetical protein IQ278_13685 [Tolypothrix sp. LEGE 11397]|nr:MULTISPECIES: hypothetical protein [unclassified Tolypothrix]MBE9083165.1 hypothetical protein [Tolypothrix sp. LEGE 11397]UYD37022.1 hypothetical protein HG267_15610 [Tolypothrix sp. PCC 7601]
MAHKIKLQPRDEYEALVQVVINNKLHSFDKNLHVEMVLKYRVISSV